MIFVSKNLPFEPIRRTQHRLLHPAMGACGSLRPQCLDEFQTSIPTETDCNCVVNNRAMSKIANSISAAIGILRRCSIRLAQCAHPR